MNKILLGTLLFTGFFSSTLHAQSIGPATINASGGSSIISGKTFEYAIGDVVQGNTLTGSSLIVTQGVLQPIFTTGINDHILAITGLDVYPSPVQSTLYLQPHFLKTGLLEYNIIDAAGKLVLSSQAVLTAGNERQSMNVESLAAGQYILQVQWLEGSNTFQSAYKVQKIQ